MPRNNDRVEVYKSGDGWRWRRVAANGKVLSESSEAYSDYSYTKNMAGDINPGIPVVFKKAVDLY